MPITQVITPLPTAPNPATMTRDQFSSAAAAFVLGQVAMEPELNTLVTQVNAASATMASDASSAAQDAADAAASAQSANGAAGAAKWVSGTTYAEGACVWSPASYNRLTYRRIVAGAGTTDPANDPVNWVQIQRDYSAAIEARMLANGVYLTAATSAATGFTAADSSNINMAANDFGWYGLRVALPDYTPSAQVVLARKHDGTNGWILTLETNGKLRLQINATTYDSTVATGLENYAPAVFGFDVLRSAISVAGEVRFFVNGERLGDAIAITAGAPTTVSNTSTLYVMGTSATRTAGTVYALGSLYNRRMTTAEVRQRALVGTDYSDISGSQTVRYTSDFSAGTNNWASFTGSTVADVDAIGGLDDWLEMTATAATASCRRTTATTPCQMPYKRSRITVTYYIPVSSTATTVQFRNSGATTTYYSSAPIKGAVTTITFEALEDLGLYGLSFVTTGNTVGDKSYIRAMTCTPIGEVAGYSNSGIQPAQWHDNSTNEIHAEFPAVSSLSQWQDSGNYRAQSVAADTTFNIPAGWMLDFVHALNKTATSITLRLGSTAGGTELVADTAIAGSTAKRLTPVVDLYSATAATPVYLYDNTGGAWASSIDYTAYFRRIT